MLDIGFSEIVVISVLALVVLGPEKLPRVAAQVGRLIGRARGMARQFREQLEEEVNLEEARKTRPAPVDPVTPPASFNVTPAATTPSPASIPPVTSPVESPVAGPVIPVEPPAPVLPVEPPAPAYPDTYSHAHPTNEFGEDISARDPRQHDWVASSSSPDKPSQPAADAAYAPANERGT